MTTRVQAIRTLISASEEPTPSVLRTWLDPLITTTRMIKAGAETGAVPFLSGAAAAVLTLLEIVQASFPTLNIPQSPYGGAETGQE